MRALLLGPLLLLALAGCTRPPEDNAAVLGVVKQRLLEREAHLGGYRFSGTVQDTGAEPIEFTFAYRAPARMRGTLLKPVSRTFAWDGEHLYVQDDARKSLTRFKDDLPADKRAGFLTETFAPFTPEGFRVPLLLSNTKVRRASHPRAPEAVELSVVANDGSEGGIEMTYLLRWPTLDFLGKRTRTADGRTAEVRVEAEHCDEKLKLCVPQRLTRWVGDTQVGRIELSQVELNPALPNDAFSLNAPAGYEVQSRTLVEVAAKPQP